MRHMEGISVCAQSAISTSTNINFLDFKLPSLIFLLFTPQALARAHDAKALSILRNHGFSPLLVVLFHLLLYVGRACWSSASTFATKLKGSYTFSFLFLFFFIYPPPYDDHNDTRDSSFLIYNVDTVVFSFSLV
ncbi:unnamed protein product [Fusarium graminearum]|nr:unnamed protein product [Fusarium graminearum]